MLINSLVGWTCRPGAGVAILAVCRRLHYARVRFVSRQQHLFSHCFGTFSICFFPFHFVFIEKNLKIIPTRLPDYTRLALSCLRIQCQDYTKCSAETDTTAARRCETYSCPTENPELGIFWTGKRTNHKTSQKYLWLSIFYFFYFCIPKISAHKICPNCAGKQVWFPLWLSDVTQHPAWGQAWMSYLHSTSWAAGRRVKVSCRRMLEDTSSLAKLVTGVLAVPENKICMSVTFTLYRKLVHRILGDHAKEE